MRFYTASYLEKLIGLPAAVCRARLNPASIYNGLVHYDLDEARKLLDVYRAERRARIDARRARQAAGLCVRCGAPRAVSGWPFCVKHLPPSVRARLGRKGGA